MAAKPVFEVPWPHDEGNDSRAGRKNVMEGAPDEYGPGVDHTMWIPTNKIPKELAGRKLMIEFGTCGQMVKIFVGFDDSSRRMETTCLFHGLHTTFASMAIPWPRK